MRRLCLVSVSTNLSLKSMCFVFGILLFFQPIFYRQHLTTILPTFRLASACSDEDMLSSNENENEQINAAAANASSDECLTTPEYHSTKMGSIGLPIKVSMEHMSTPGRSHNTAAVSGQSTSSAKPPRVTLEQKGTDYW